MAEASKIEQFRTVHFQFAGEQDGSPERDLKTSLVQLFVNEPCIYRAYLARIAYEHPSSNGVALCLRAQPGKESDIVNRVGSIFASSFAVREHLDIMFITDAQECELTKFCRPFFRGNVDDGGKIREK